MKSNGKAHSKVSTAPEKSKADGLALLFPDPHLRAAVRGLKRDGLEKLAKLYRDWSTMISTALAFPDEPTTDFADQEIWERAEVLSQCLNLNFSACAVIDAIYAHCQRLGISWEELPSLSNRRIRAISRRVELAERSLDALGNYEIERN